MPESTDLLPAPDLSTFRRPDSKFDREAAAFRRLLPELLPLHRGEYAAIHNERAIDFDSDQAALAMRCYERLGRVAVYVGLVTDTPEPVIHLRSPRVPDQWPPQTRSESDS